MSIAIQAKDTIREIERFPVGYLSPIDEMARHRATEWLDSAGGIQTLGFLLRMDRERATWIGEMPLNDPRRLQSIHDSAFAAAGIVREALDYASPRGSRRREDLVFFPSLHACAVRGSVHSLKRMLSSKLFDPHGSIVAGLLTNTRVTVPEVSKERFDAARNRQRVASFKRGIKSKSPTSHWSDFGLASDRHEWAGSKGRGQVVCVLDSGVDESHPSLREQVKWHALFDSYGNYKEAKYAFDRGCHGTKISGLIAGRLTSLGDLINEPEWECQLELGLAPEARIVSVNVLQGDCLAEGGSLMQFLAGADWAIQHRGDPEAGGFEVVTISIEATGLLSSEVNTKADDILGMMQFQGLLPILASGNNGKKSHKLGRVGTYVGAANPFGRPWSGNGPAQLLVPGVDLPCCQPAIEQLGNDSIGIHTGTSLAAAVASALIVRFKEITGKGAKECLAAMIASGQGRGGWISIDDTLDALA